MIAQFDEAVRVFGWLIAKERTEALAKDASSLPESTRAGSNTVRTREIPPTETRLNVSKIRNGWRVSK
jgi:hypothetical protein